MCHTGIKYRLLITGVVRAMEAAIDHLDMGTWSGKVVVIQGGGGVGK